VLVSVRATLGAIEDTAAGAKRSSERGLRKHASPADRGGHVRPLLRSNSLIAIRNVLLRYHGSARRAASNCSSTAGSPSLPRVLATACRTARSGSCKSGTSALIASLPPILPRASTAHARTGVSGSPRAIEIRRGTASRERRIPRASAAAALACGSAASRRRRMAPADSRSSRRPRAVAAWPRTRGSPRELRRYSMFPSLRARRNSKIRSASSWER
jgi:hypothetical protein